MLTQNKTTDRCEQILLKRGIVASVIHEPNARNLAERYTIGQLDGAPAWMALGEDAASAIKSCRKATAKGIRATTAIRRLANAAH